MHFKNADGASLNSLYVSEGTKGQSKKHNIKFIFTRVASGSGCEECILERVPDICLGYMCIGRGDDFYVAKKYKQKNN